MNTVAPADDPGSAGAAAHPRPPKQPKLRQVAPPAAPPAMPKPRRPVPATTPPPAPSAWQALKQRFGLGSEVKTAAAAPDTAPQRQQWQPKQEQQQEQEQEQKQHQYQQPLQPSPAATGATDSAIPAALRQRYLVANDSKFYFRDRGQTLAFEDLGSRLRTTLNDPDVATSMVELAQAKGWHQLKLRGTQEFKRAAWLAAAERGLATHGYRASAADQARLAERLQQRQQETQQRESANTIAKAVTTETADSAAAPPHQRPKRARKQKSPAVPAKDAPAREPAKPASPAADPQQRQALTELRKFLRQRGDSEQAIAMTVQLASSQLAQRRTHFGQLLEHGNAPYQHDKDNDSSYFVTLKTAQGRQTVWGVDLERAMADSGATVGEGIVLMHEGQRPVTVKTTERDQTGRPTGKLVELDTERNQWEVISLDNARDFAAQQRPAAASRSEPGPAKLPPAGAEHARGPAQEPARQRS